MSERMETGSVLGRYVIEGAIGEGGMGVVYRARDGRLGRKVAIKVIPKNEDDPESDDRVKRFLREARAAAALDHPNAVAIFDVGETEGLSFIAMELVTGTSLRRYVGDASVAISTRLGWLADIAAALAAAHRARLIHRDVKPENVMIRDDGRVKVLDFGLARRVAPPPEPKESEIADHGTTETGTTTLTAVGTLLGTPQYMAPEQIRSEPLDGRSDEFSWGVLAYELLTGVLPWQGTGIHVMARILTDRPKPLRELNPDVPEEVVAVVERALARNAEERFSSMDEIVAALEPFLDPQSRSGPRSLRGRSMAPPKPPTTPPPSDNPTKKSPDFVPPKVASPVPPRAARAPKVEVVDAPPAPRAEEAAPLSRGAIWIAAALALALGVIIGWRVLRAQASSGEAPVASASASSAAAPAATAITDLPEPKSSSPEALAAYRAGLVELRFGGTRDAFEGATALDPSLAQAHLYFAVDAIESEFSDAARAHLRKAAELRASLSARDQLLLDAVEPVLLRQPADWAEGARRITAAVERFPGDAHLWYVRGVLAQSAEGLEASTRHLSRASALDPKYAQAFGMQAENLAYLGRFAEARQAAEQCRALAPAYVTCASELSRVLEHEGACEEEEAMARQLVAASPKQDAAQDLLARALAARNKPETAVREALKLKWAALSEAQRKKREPEDTLALALWEGDFTAAERIARSLEAAAETSRAEIDHARPARALAQIFLEMGRLADAGQVAQAFLGRHDAWEPDPRSEDFAMAGDATPVLLAAALKGGKITRAELAQKRAEWVRAWDRKMPIDLRRYTWAHGWAATVDTPDDAREALAAMADFAPIPTFYPHTLVEAPVGLTFLLAGRTDEAAAWLERATRACRVLEFPVEHTRAHLWLGMAREAKGDKPGACAAYQVVRARWGKAKPRSVTAEKASERLRALACPL
jgi:serine/threonine-protein kinase